MIDIALLESGSQKMTADLSVLPFFKGDKKVEKAFSTPAVSPFVRAAIEAGDFSGKEHELLFLYPPEGKDRRVVLLGLGEKKHCNAECLRLAGAAVAKSIQKKKITSLHFIAPEGICASINEAAVAIFEGILLGSYRFDHLKSKHEKTEKPAHLQKVYVSGVDKIFLKSAKRHSSIVNAVNFTRDLVNGNADDVQSESVMQIAKDLSRKYASIKVEILLKKQLEKEKLGLILAVNRAAVRDPALVILQYRGRSTSSDLTALVGKGVTFDTGGLNLKTTGNMETMKCDMAGAGAVLGIFKAVADLKLKVNLIGLLPLVENAIGPMSYKPGDVYTSHSGKTVEISNTDAEGRLVLADSLSYLQTHFSPTRIIDLATLTGAIVIALGEEAAGLFCNDEELTKALYAAGRHSGDRVWPMPLYKEYRKALKSKIADIKNSGGRPGGSCSAAAFLQEFIHKKGERQASWAHLDIASTAYLDEPKGLHPTSATGAGVRLILEFLTNLK